MKKGLPEISIYLSKISRHSMAELEMPSATLLDRVIDVKVLVSVRSLERSR